MFIFKKKAPYAICYLAICDLLKADRDTSVFSLCLSIRVYVCFLAFLLLTHTQEKKTAALRLFY